MKLAKNLLYILRIKTERLQATESFRLLLRKKALSSMWLEGFTADNK